eukprot:Anaeramoba_ignava/a357719_8.p1 GENE.a357719_8~~a357719_8.p1  ORF type:complete len:292 (+),score=45.88 a357719_8:451-1326(+)
MKLMMNIKWENNPCYLCGNDKNFIPVKKGGEQFVAGQYGYAVFPVICEKCGLVMLNPRWSKKDYDIFYKYYYDNLYRLDLKKDYGTEGVIKNMEIIYNRIKSVIKNEKINILDAGAGSGVGFNFLKDKLNKVKFYAIESSDESINSLKKNGALVIADDLDSDWDKEYSSSFDLIILRHVIEHFMNPIENLEKIARSLKKDGILYLATPDMKNPRVILRDYDSWFEYWFRAVHTYYFSNETLIATMAKAGLKPILIKNENEEIWCAAQKCEPYDSYYENEAEKIIKIINKNS